MLPEIGHFSLILAFIFAFLLFVVPLMGYYTGNRILLATARPLTFLMSFWVVVSFLLLVTAFLTDDFSVLYVSQNSNSQLPVWYKVSAVWGGHEGSLLLWVLILSGWSSMVAIKSHVLPNQFLSVVLSVMGGIGTGFLSFMLFTSSPFTRLLPETPVDGRDLNPLLQDIGLIIHPPMLYMGYVGFSVAFAFAIAALITGDLHTSWAKWVKPWTAFAWAFLTLGITLGSWWAYYELGWGGWWFWDPVENASLMPWLAGTALIHSLSVTLKRGAFKSWTVLLAIFAFSLSLLGTFLVRSGVLTSVHAFASDPTRGVFILILLMVIVGSSLLLYTIRASQVRSSVTFSISGREAWLLVNNILLIVLTLTVLLGTLYPLLFDALGLGKISVGAPYFNAVFSPIALLLMVFMAVGPLSKWRHTPVKPLLKLCATSGAIALIVSLLFTYWCQLGVFSWLSLLIAFWVIFLTLRDFWGKLLSGRKGLIFRIKQLPQQYYAMLIAHLGLAVTLIGILFVSVNSHEALLKMSPGETAQLAGYKIRFDGMAHITGSNYTANRSCFSIFQGKDLVATLHPEKRRYNSNNQVMTEAGLDPGFTRDVYISLGEPLDSGSWSVRVYIKSFVRWIWAGGIMMMIGGFLSVWEKRKRQKRESN